MTKRDARNNLGCEGPTFTPELGARIEELYQLIGGQKVSADLVGATSETLRQWKLGTSKMPLLAATLLCARAGKSLDWLATGKEAAKADKSEPTEPPTTIKEARLRDIIEAVEDYLAANGLALDSPKKALLIVSLYNILEEENKDVSTASKLVERMIRVAS